MKTYKHLYSRITSYENLLVAWQKARKGKTKKAYVIEFEKHLEMNLTDIREELLSQEYLPKPLITFILRDPKTRNISKSDFRDRVVHHALCNIVEPLFNKTFIHDSCANRTGKGTLFALQRFEVFRRKITNNFTKEAFCLKADIKHYFQEVDHEVLLSILKRKIADQKALWLIQQIINNNSANFGMKRERLTSWLEPQKGMPLGNLTSQFFANVYLNELDHFVKHVLKAKYYIRYVDDFVIVHTSKKQLIYWKDKIDRFLKETLQIQLHPQKSRIISLSKGIDFVGFRNYYHYKLLRKRNIRKIQRKIAGFEKNELSYHSLVDCFQGWQAYAKWGNAFNVRKKVAQQIARAKYKRLKEIEEGKAYLKEKI